MTTLERTFRFEAAHRLAHGYKGKCANIHGHSWNGKIVVGKEDDKLDEMGMLADFSVLKAVITPLIEDFDHCLLLNHDDVELRELCKKNGWKWFSFGKNPTSEIVASWLFSQWSHLFAEKGLTLLEVVIEETCTSRCSVKKYPIVYIDRDGK